MTTIATAPAPTGTDDFEALRAVVAGRLVTRADDDFQAVRTPWVVNVDQQPAAVLEVAHVGDVVEAVRWAAAPRPLGQRPADRARASHHARRHPAAAHPRPAGHRGRPGPAAPSPSAPASSGASCAPPSTAPA